MIERLRITVRGVVQGVGFRPFAYRLARRHGICGAVSNTGDGVVIEAEGEVDSVSAFLKDIKEEAPPLAGIVSVDFEPEQLRGEKVFLIKNSSEGSARSPFIPSDIATCSDCLTELLNPHDRRYRYPFINCTNCGPRFTIISGTPYDRRLTSMTSFAMCTLCRQEYDNPADRRFHAQPNACPDCGPHVTLLSPSGSQIAARQDAIQLAGGVLRDGKILAVKGLGGFHLAADATNMQAVMLLRERKGRADKPLAIMVRDVESARRVCRVTDEEEHLLVSPQRPIVLLDRLDHKMLANNIAPGCKTIGVMLAYAPLHHLLLAEAPEYLVMTSGNLSEEPIAIANQEALERLCTVADAFLVHDREILLRCDDSVMQVAAGGGRFLRRSRGFVPLPIALPGHGATVLGTGAELKNAICILKDGQAFIGPHVGDLKNLESNLFFRETVAHMTKLFEAKPELVAHDLHPEYFSTRWAQEQCGFRTVAVQHHHAHLVACMAENGVEEPVVGLIMDGTGYGEDGTVWGGEILTGDACGYQRIGHFEVMPLPGGDAAIRAPWRTAVAYLQETYGEAMPDLPFLGRHEWKTVAGMAAARVNSPGTSSCGRLFDAVAAMAGGRQSISYEAQAAIELMEVAVNPDLRTFPFELRTENGMLILPVRELIRGVVDALLAGMPLAIISGIFHQTLAELFARSAIHALQITGLRHVVLSGGVFQNRLLLNKVMQEFSRQGVSVYCHSKLPAGDGCISFGQAVIGRGFCKGN